ncbi:MAG: conjugal transfer protein TrbL family protein [Enterocloster clostridioformis]
MGALCAQGLWWRCSECGIDYQTGRGSVKETALNAIKGFLAVSLFTTAPVELYKLCVSLQGSFTAGITGLGDDFGTVAAGIVNSLKDAGTWEAAATSGVFGGLTSITSPVLMIFHPDSHGLCHYQGVFRQFKTGRYLTDPDCGWQPVYVQRAAWLY